jgi:hypothetical protein
VAGEVTLLYHGTTRSFQKFELAHSREELVNNYYGVGIFLTPSKRVAEKYAQANRNIGLDPAIITDLKRINPKAGGFLQALVSQGDDAWMSYALMLREQGLEPSDLDEYLGVDSNNIGNIAAYVLGSHVKALGSDSGPFLFNQTSGAPEWLYDLLDEVGLDSGPYRPKVYTVAVRVQKPLVTASQTQARKAKTQGYDSVVFFGSSLVDGVPEVAVFSPKDTHILKAEVLS